MSIFTTRTNQAFNTFADQQPFAMDNAGWEVDPNYLTQSFDAPYRPAYNGGNGAFNPSYDPGFFKSAYALASPTFQPPPWGNPVDNYHPFMESVYGRPMDTAAEIQQRLAFPMLSFALAYKVGNTMVKRRNALGGGVAAGVSELFGGTPGKMRKAIEFQGIYSSIGDQFAQGAVSSSFNFARKVSKAGFLGDSANAIAARTFMTEGAGILGGAVSGFALPWMAGEAMERGVDKAVFDPYIANRRIGRNLRENFAHIDLGNAAYGNAETGLGLSFEKSQKIAGKISDAGIKDWMFTPQDMAEISDLSARSGLLDNVKADQIASRVSDIAKQVKLVMRVGNIIKKSEVFEVLQKLQEAGVSAENGAAGNVYATIGAFSTIAGVSPQRMMNTVGMQSQYMFQGNNLVPYLGQIGAAKSFASFASAYRSGLISPALLASMGGAEGATQSVTGGQIAGENTIYNSLVLANRYLLGNRDVKGGIAGQLATSGRAFAQDPVKWSGALGMYGPLMQSMDQLENGPMGLQNQVMDMVKSASPWEVKKNGHIDAEVAYEYLTQGIGLTHDQALANLKQWQSVSDPKTRKIMENGLRANMIQQTLQYADQEGLRYGPLVTPWRAVKRFGMGIQSAFNHGWSSIMQATGHGMDSLERAYHGEMYGEIQKSHPIQFNSIGDFRKSAEPPSQIDLINTGNIRNDDIPMALGGALDEDPNSVSRNSDIGLTIQSINYGATLGENKDKHAAAIIDLMKGAKPGAAPARDTINKIAGNLVIMASEGKLPDAYKNQNTNTELFQNLAKQIYSQGVNTVRPGNVESRKLLDTKGLITEDEYTQNHGLAAVGSAIKAGISNWSIFGVARDLWHEQKVMRNGSYDVAVRRLDDIAKEGGAKSVLAYQAINSSGEAQSKALKLLAPDLGVSIDDLGKLKDKMSQLKKVAGPDIQTAGILGQTGRHLYEATSDAEGKGITMDQRESIIESAQQILDATHNGTTNLESLEEGGDARKAAEYLKKYYKGMSLDNITDVIAKAKELYGRGFDQRVLNQNEMTGQGDQNLEETVNKALKNPGKYLTAAQKKVLDKATSETEKRQVVYAALAQNNGVTALQEGVRVLPESATLEEKRAMAGISKQFDENEKYINKVSSENKIDYQTQLAMHSANQMEKSISQFGQFVQVFGDAINRMNGGNSNNPGSKDSQTSPSQPSFWSMNTLKHPINYLNSVFSDNSRPG